MELIEILRCPECGNSLKHKNKEYCCCNCNVEFQNFLGIPDFRLSSSPILLEREIAGDLAQMYSKSNFESLVSLYFDRVGEFLPDLRDKYIKYRLTYAERGEQIIKEIKESMRQTGRTVNHENALDLGCGSGGSLISLSYSFKYVIGIDISLIELILAKKLLEELSIRNVALICGDAENLPFANDSLDFIVALDVIEHVVQQRKVIQGTHRVLKNGGHLFFTSPNRFSLSLEPHVNLRFVGFFPRSIAPYYVGFRKGVPYTGKRLLSYFELTRIMRDVFGKNFEISLYRKDMLKRRRIESLFKLHFCAELLYLFYPVHTIISFKE